MAEQPPSSDPMTTFGPNEWLVDELYEQYTRDKNSVDRAWWDFFRDYEPGEAAFTHEKAVGDRRSAGNGQGNGTAAPTERAKAEPAAKAPAAPDKKAPAAPDK